MDNLGTSIPSGKESKGPIVGIVVIIVLLILGGVYLWQAQTPVEAPINNNGTATTTATSTDLETMGTSTDPADLEAEAKATDLNELEANLDEVSAEVEIQ